MNPAYWLWCEADGRPCIVKGDEPHPRSAEALFTAVQVVLARKDERDMMRAEIERAMAAGYLDS